MTFLCGKCGAEYDDKAKLYACAHAPIRHEDKKIPPSRRRCREMFQLLGINARCLLYRAHSGRCRVTLEWFPKKPPVREARALREAKARMEVRR